MSMCGAHVYLLVGVAAVGAEDHGRDSLVPIGELAAVLMSSLFVGDQACATPRLVAPGYCPVAIPGRSCMEETVTGSGIACDLVGPSRPGDPLVGETI